MPSSKESYIPDILLLHIRLPYESHMMSTDIVTCMALDRVGTGEHLITGSRDTTCVVWRFGSNVSIQPHHCRD